MKYISKLIDWFKALKPAFKLVVLLLAIGLGWFAYSKIKGSAASKTDYQTATVSKGTIVVSVSASGSVSAAQAADVTTNASGVVSKVYVKNGDKVKTGQAIAYLDLDQIAKQKYVSAVSSYQSAKNSFDSAQANLYTKQSSEFAANQKFINDAVARDLTTDDPTYIQENADWLAAEASYKIQEAAIKQAQNSLSSAALSLQQASPTIYSPISGTVTGLSLQQGTVIAEGSTGKVASVVTGANPTVSVNLTQIDAPSITVGDKATITLDAFSDKTFTGKVISIDTVGETSSGVTSYPVVIKLDSPNDQIYANMSATANIITNSKSDILTVPSGAIQTDSNGGSYVRVMKNGQIQNVTVQTGISNDTDTEIVSGLSEGDTVVTGEISTGSPSNSRTNSTSPFSIFGGNRGGGGNVRIRNFGG